MGGRRKDFWGRNPLLSEIKCQLSDGVLEKDVETRRFGGSDLKSPDISVREIRKIYEGDEGGVDI